MTTQGGADGFSHAPLNRLQDASLDTSDQTASDVLQGLTNVVASFSAQLALTTAQAIVQAISVAEQHQCRQADSVAEQPLRRRADIDTQRSTLHSELKKSLREPLSKHLAAGDTARWLAINSFRFKALTKLRRSATPRADDAVNYQHLSDRLERLWARAQAESIIDRSAIEQWINSFFDLRVRFRNTLQSSNFFKLDHPKWDRKHFQALETPYLGPYRDMSHAVERGRAWATNAASEINKDNYLLSGAISLGLSTCESNSEVVGTNILSAITQFLDVDQEDHEISFELVNMPWQMEKRLAQAAEAALVAGRADAEKRTRSLQQAIKQAAKRSSASEGLAAISALVEAWERNSGGGNYLDLRQETLIEIELARDETGRRAVKQAMNKIKTYSAVSIGTAILAFLSWAVMR